MIVLFVTVWFLYLTKVRDGQVSAGLFSAPLSFSCFCVRDSGVGVFKALLCVIVQSMLRATKSFATKSFADDTVSSKKLFTDRLGQPET